MIQAKCINKIKNKYGVIEQYTLQDKTGETITVTSKQLKDAILAGKIEIVNLQLTKNNRLMDKNIEDTLKSYSIMDSNINEQKSKAQYSKSVMLGMAPVLNEHGHVVDVDSERVLFTDATNIFSRSIYAENVTATFSGTKEINKVMTYMPLTLQFKEVIVNNPCLMTNIGNGNSMGIKVISRDITIKHNCVDIKTVDEIFRLLKNQHKEGYTGNVFKIKIEPGAGNLNTDDIFDRACKILKRQKPSSNNCRRAYDLLIYLQFIYSMWLSTNNDKRYIDIAQMYIEEFYTLKRYIMRSNDSHASSAYDIMDICLEEIVQALK